MENLNNSAEAVHNEQESKVRQYERCAAEALASRLEIEWAPFVGK